MRKITDKEMEWRFVFPVRNTIPTKQLEHDNIYIKKMPLTD